MADLELLRNRAEEARTLCARMRGHLEGLLREKEEKERLRAEQEHRAEILDKVAGAFRLASEIAREQARLKVEQSVTNALQAVFGSSVKFKAEISDRGNRPWAEFLIASNYGGAEVETPILDARGGGVVDVVSVALRVLAATSITPSKAPIILDEPGKHLSEGYSRAFGELLKAVAEETGRQIIATTHDPRLAETADVVYRVKIENGSSKAEKL